MIRTEAHVRDCRVMRCDVCDAMGPIVPDVLDDDPVLELARLDGWIVDEDERDVCPKCQGEKGEG